MGRWGDGEIELFLYFLFIDLLIYDSPPPEGLGVGLLLFAEHSVGTRLPQICIPCKNTKLVLYSRVLVYYAIANIKSGIIHTIQTL